MKSVKIELYCVTYYTYVMNRIITNTFNDYAWALEDYQKKKSANYVGLKLFKKEIVETELLCAGHTRPPHHAI